MSTRDNTDYRNIRDNVDWGKDKDRLDTQAYFNSLPKYLQENIRQAGISFDTVEEMRKIKFNLLDPPQ